MPSPLWLLDVTISFVQLADLQRCSLMVCNNVLNISIPVFKNLELSCSNKMTAKLNFESIFVLFTVVGIKLSELGTNLEGF